MLSEIAKNLSAVTQTLQASVRMLKVKVHDSTIRKSLFSQSTNFGTMNLIETMCMHKFMHELCIQTFQ